MERERGHLDEEGQREGDEQPLLRALAQRRLRQPGDRERHAALRSRPARRCHRRGQHEQRADERVDDELERRRHPVGPAPLADQEVERHQHQVEEEDEKDQVLGEEGAQHGGLGEPEVERVEAGPARRRPQRDPQRGGGEEQRGERDEPQVQPVDAEHVADAEVLDPGVVGHVLQAGRPVSKSNSITTT